MLAPIQHYVRDLLLPPDTTCLQEIHTFYYFTVGQCWEERDDDADIIISDHLNIEHVIAFNLTHIPGAEDTYYTCWRFLRCLEWHLPRPTTLTPAIFNIVKNSSAWKPKAYCLWYPGNLHLALSQCKEAIQAFQAAEQLYLTIGNHEMVACCISPHADIYTCQGRFIQSQQVLEDLQHSDLAKLFTFTTSADKLFVNFLDEDFWGLWSKICHWRVKHFYGEDVVQVEMHLEDLLLQCSSTGILDPCRDALEALAEVVFCGGRLSDAIHHLQEIVEMYKGDDPSNVLWYAVWKAIIVSNQGHHDLAREIIHKASQNVPFCALPSTASFLHRSYGSACIELNAGEYDRAVSHSPPPLKVVIPKDILISRHSAYVDWGRLPLRKGTLH
ncbi:hypothetical protein F4604DRAFT_1932087 [Suillus subluteus]|nr:hypothetical protein F4604DRAFT_1932087 [Suillus subluteus]